MSDCAKSKDSTTARWWCTYIVLAENAKSTKLMNQTSNIKRAENQTESSFTQNQPAKNVLAPGTRKTYAEAMKHGANMQGA